MRGAVEGEAMLGEAGLEPLQSVVHHLWADRSFHVSPPECPAGRYI